MMDITLHTIGQKFAMSFFGMQGCKQALSSRWAASRLRDMQDGIVK